MLGRGGIAPAVGLAGGVLAGLLFARFAGNAIAGIDPADPMAFAVVPLLVAGIVVAAIAIPVGRVLRRNPTAALRVE